MVKSTFFFYRTAGLRELCKYLDRDEVLKISTESGGERYRKSFDAWTHLRIGCVPKRSTLGDANAKRSESIFGDNNFMPKPANLDDGDVRLSQGRHDAQGEGRFVC